MKVDGIARRVFAMPLSRPSYPPGACRYTNREMLIMTCRTDARTPRVVSAEAM
jgi:acetoacetate decarboxylase